MHQVFYIDDTLDTGVWDLLWIAIKANLQRDVA